MVVEFGVRVLSTHCGVEEFDDFFAVVGDVQDVLLQGVLDAHRSLSVRQSFSRSGSPPFPVGLTGCTGLIGFLDSCLRRNDELDYEFYDTHGCLDCQGENLTSMEGIEGIFHPHPNLPPSRGKGQRDWEWLPILCSAAGCAFGCIQYASHLRCRGPRAMGVLWSHRSTRGRGLCCKKPHLCARLRR